MDEAPVKKQLKCFCARKPMLAMYGVDAQGKLFIHVKVWKQNRIYGEILITEGTVKLRCRECLRWHTVKIRQPGTAVLQETDEPAEVGESGATPLLAEPAS
jgi:hypothetical protein